jgi:hypothetical protein
VSLNTGLNSNNTTSNNNNNQDAFHQQQLTHEAGMLDGQTWLMTPGVESREDGTVRRTYHHPTACLSYLFSHAGTGLAEPKSPVARCASPAIEDAGLAHLVPLLATLKTKSTRMLKYLLLPTYIWGKQDRQCTYNVHVILRRVRATSVAVDKRLVLHILSVPL